MKKIGQILRANQEIKTRPLELIQQVSLIENCISDRLSAIRLFNMRHGESVSIKAEYGDINMLRVKNAKDAFKIDIVKFFKNEEYALKCIELYDAVKQSYNPLRIIHDVPHYRGYWESILSSHEGSKLLSAKYRILGSKVPAYISSAKVIDPTLKEQVYRNAESAIDTYFRRLWMLHSKDFAEEFNEKMKDSKFRKEVEDRMRLSKDFKEKLDRKLALSKDFRILLPASSDDLKVYAFIDNTSLARLNLYPREIVLGTPLGDANFKLWMERNVIPDLKRKYPDNKFLLNLQPVLNSNTQLGVISINLGLPINMMPDKGDEYGQDLLREYRESFNQLGSAEAYAVGFNKKMAIKDLFYLYSLISNNGRVGPRSLHGIMQDFDGDIVKSYRLSIALLDKELTDPNSEAYKNVLKMLNSDAILAPFSTPWKGGSDVFKYRDSRVDYVSLYAKRTEDDDYMDADLDFAQSLMEDQMDFNPFNEERGTAIPNNYRDASGVNMLQDSDFNYFTFPEVINTEPVTTTTFGHGKILTQPIKNKKGEIIGHKLVDIVPDNEYVDVLPQVIKELQDNYDNGVPLVTILEGGIKKLVIHQDIIKGLFENFKNGCS